MVMPLLLSLAMVLFFQVLAALGIQSVGRRRRAVGALVLLVLVVLALAIRQIGLVPWFVSAFLAGFVVRRAVDRGARLWRAALLGLLPVVLVSGLPLALSAPLETWSDLEQEVAALVGPAPGPSGSEVGPEELELAELHRELATLAATWLLRLFPAELLVFHLAQVLAVVVLAGVLARRAGHSDVRVLPVSAWRVPFATVWFLAGGLGLAATRNELGTIVGLNVVLVTGMLLAVQGFAVGLAFLERSVPVAVRYALLLLTALTAFPFMVAGAALLGIADLWVDFRRPRLASQDTP